MTLELPRRKFLIGLASLIAAPAVVRASSLMPVRVRVLKLYTIADYKTYIINPMAITLDVLYGTLSVQPNWLLEIPNDLHS